MTFRGETRPWAFKQVLTVLQVSELQMHGMIKGGGVAGDVVCLSLTSIWRVGYYPCYSTPEHQSNHQENSNKHIHNSPPTYSPT